MVDLRKKKILLMDLDDTLITTRSRNVFPEGLWDIEFKMSTLVKIRDMVEMGKLEHFGIITNQGGVESGYVAMNDIMSKVEFCAHAVNDFCKGKLKSLINEVSFTNDPEYVFRKPNEGMAISYWRDLYKVAGIGEKYARENSVYVGDASGLPGDFSDSDKKFAENAGIDYMDVKDFVKFDLTDNNINYMP